MQQHPQILAVYTELTAYFVLVPLLEENLTQQPPIALWKLVQNLPDFLFRFSGNQNPQKIDSEGGEIPLFFIVERTMACGGAIMLQ